MATPVIPTYITVHLGDPNDSSARNLRVPFDYYIKNVASSEVYPTWPETALRANIYAQVSFALNRVYTEWYPSRGYDFDITSTTSYDQKFIENRDIFEPISRLVDSLFNDYIVRQGYIQPLFAQYCNGTTVVCSGLSQWGSVGLAREGLIPYEILQYYYGDNINIVFNAPTRANLASYPGIPLRVGSAGEEVRTLKRQLNRIGQNFPGVSPYLEVTPFFDVRTEEAVKSFQGIFNLSQDGIVGKSTWYKIKSIFNGVKGLSELESEGLTPEEVEREFARELKPGDTGVQVGIVEYILGVIAFFDPNLPSPTDNQVYDQETERAVRAFQAQEGLRADGIVGRETWNALLRRYDRVIASIPEEYMARADEIYPGRFLSIGQRGEEVRRLQRFLGITADGIFGQGTAAAVRAAQEAAGLPVNGVVGPLTWRAIVEAADAQRV